MRMILLIDNYDSFVYNLARYVSELGLNYCVKRNDALNLADIIALNPSHIIISPGPCTPNEAGISLATIRELGPTIPILGVCLGHQAIGQAYGGKVVPAKQPTHGRASRIWHHQQGLFKKLKNPLWVGRYHSLVVSPDELPAELIVTAHSEDREIMALAHVHHPVYGVQFHPESILTEEGHAIIKNFIHQDTNPR